MAKITIDIPDAQVNRVIEAVCKNNGYQSEIEAPTGDGGVANPETPAQFTKRWIISIIKSQVAGYEGATAQETAAKNVDSEIAIK